MASATTWPQVQVALLQTGHIDLGSGFVLEKLPGYCPVTLDLEIGDLPVNPLRVRFYPLRAPCVQRVPANSFARATLERPLARPVSARRPIARRQRGSANPQSAGRTCKALPGGRPVSRSQLDRIFAGVPGLQTMASQEIPSLPRSGLVARRYLRRRMTVQHGAGVHRARSSSGHSAIGRRSGA